MAEVQIAARIDKEMKDELVEYCKKHDATMSQVIRKAVKWYLEKCCRRGNDYED